MALKEIAFFDRTGDTTVTIYFPSENNTYTRPDFVSQNCYIDDPRYPVTNVTNQPGFNPCEPDEFNCIRLGYGTKSLFIFEFLIVCTRTLVLNC